MKYILTVLAVLMLLTSCGGDTPGPAGGSGGVATATFSISTRASENETDPTEPTDNEMINYWWVAFVKNGKVTLIAERDANLNYPVEREPFTVELEGGVYTVYAFANIGAEDHLGFKEGQSVPTGIDTKTWSDVPGYGQLVPMTSRIDNVTLTPGSEARFEIEVVRLVAKMKVEVRNETGKTIKLEKITFTPAQSDKVNFFPEIGSLGAAPVLADGSSVSDLEHNLGLEIDDEKAESEIFYLLESSAADHPTGCYVVKMDIEYGTGRKDRLTALMDELHWINRNDYIYLPLKIIDYTLDVGVNFYPPIGGYPAYIVEKKDDEYYATFGSSGKFVIKPTVTDSKGRELGLSEYSVSLVTTDENRILSVKPSVDPKTFEITGELATGEAAGKAIVEISVTTTYNGGTTPISYTFKRNLHIIRQ